MTNDALYEPFEDFNAWVGLSVSEEIWNRYLETLKERRSTLSAPDDAREIQRSLIAAALNTGAIEGLHRAGRGLTQTVIDHALDWQLHVAASEGDSAALYVAAGLDVFNLALDAATGSRGPVTQVLIREMHEVACSPQKTADVFANVQGRMVRSSRPLLLGAYKEAPNHVTLPDGSIHAYCPVDQVAIEMGRLIEEINSPLFVSAHPVLQTAFVHHAFVSIHPFQDGNGRVSRALASVFLLRAASIPLLVYEDQQLAYFDALAAADVGERQPFVTFIEARAVDLLGLSADLVASSGPGDIGFSRVVTPAERAGNAAGAVSTRITEYVRKELERIVRSATFGAGVVANVFDQPSVPGAKDSSGRRTLQSPFPSISMRAEQFGCSANSRLATYVASDLDSVFPISIGAASGSSTEFRLSDVHPSITVSTESRIKAFVARVVSEVTSDLQTQLDLL